MKPKSDTLSRTLSSTTSGLTFTRLAITDGYRTLFSICWYTTKKMIVTMPAVVRVQECCEHRHRGPERRPDERDEVGEGDPQGEDERARHAEQQEADQGRRPGDRTDDQVADHVAADRSRRVDRRGAHGLAPARGHDAERCRAHRLGLAEEQERQHGDRQEGDECAEHRGDVVERRAAQLLGEIVEFLSVVLHQRAEVQPGDQAADRPPAGRSVVHRARQVGDDADELGAHREQEQAEQAQHGGQRAEHDDPGGQVSSAAEAGLHPTGGWGEHDGEEAGDHHPRDDLHRDQHDLHEDVRAEHHADRADDRLPRHVAPRLALRWLGWRRLGRRHPEEHPSVVRTAVVRHRVILQMDRLMRRRSALAIVGRSRVVPAVR